MIVSRFAPSPTGRLHLGHAYSAVLAHARARSRNGKFLLRIEDLDQTRSRPEFVEAIFADLRWLALGWDEPLLIQSTRTQAYQQALDDLKARHLVFACYCTRADIAQSLNAPHGEAATSYPGTCRNLPDDPARRAARPHCWRLNSAKALELVGLPSWREADDRQFIARPFHIDDVILARKDAPASYHLACVIDDAASGANLVVRGEDLRPSTPVQRILQELLGLPQPCYFHHRIVAHSNGRRLAKRDLAPTLAAMRENGTNGSELAARLLAGELPLGFAFLDG
jgi:glutamyl-Q tRNA(Asp) synthetase